jgi:hypothetical protein
MPPRARRGRPDISTSGGTRQRRSGSWLTSHVHCSGHSERATRPDRLPWPWVVCRVRRCDAIRFNAGLPIQLSIKIGAGRSPTFHGRCGPLEARRASGGRAQFAHAPAPGLLARCVSGVRYSRPSPGAFHGYACKRFPEWPGSTGGTSAGVRVGAVTRPGLGQYPRAQNLDRHPAVRAWTLTGRVDGLLGHRVGPVLHGERLPRCSESAAPVIQDLYRTPRQPFGACSLGVRVFREKYGNAGCFLGSRQPSRTGWQ